MLMVQMNYQHVIDYEIVKFWKPQDHINDRHPNNTVTMLFKTSGLKLHDVIPSHMDTVWMSTITHDDGYVTSIEMGTNQTRDVNLWRFKYDSPAVEHAQRLYSFKAAHSNTTYTWRETYDDIITRPEY